MERSRLLIATHNKGKFQQMKDYLSDIPFTLVSLSELGITDDIEETGTTYEENATLKAQAYAQLSGLLTITDDGGIEIKALNGEPGIYSSRYAGHNKTDEEKVAFILEKMKHVPPDTRQVDFICVIALTYPDGDTKLFRGVSQGIITQESRGIGRPGLPYLRIYQMNGYPGKTVAQLIDEGIPFKYHRHAALDEIKGLFKI